MSTSGMEVRGVQGLLGGAAPSQPSLCPVTSLSPSPVIPRPGSLGAGPAQGPRGPAFPSGPRPHSPLACLSLATSDFLSQALHCSATDPGTEELSCPVTRMAYTLGRPCRSLPGTDCGSGSGRCLLLPTYTTRENRYTGAKLGGPREGALVPTTSRARPLPGLPSLSPASTATGTCVHPNSRGLPPPRVPEPRPAESGLTPPGNLFRAPTGHCELTGTGTVSGAAWPAVAHACGSEAQLPLSHGHGDDVAAAWRVEGPETSEWTWLVLSGALTPPRCHGAVPCPCSPARPVSSEGGRPAQDF